MSTIYIGGSVTSKFFFLLKLKTVLNVNGDNDVTESADIRYQGAERKVSVAETTKVISRVTG